jgi:DNA-binding transcriptional ArsR family regulator
VEKNDALAILDVLSQETRLDVLEMLVAVGPEGLSAGAIAERLDRSPGSLSFHLFHLTSAGLISQRRVGRRIIYRAETAGVIDLVAYLRTRCCERELRLDGEAALTALFGV